MPIGN